jgi:Flp pilus assembly protein TadG
MCCTRPRHARPRRAAATVELAVLAPFLAFLFVAVVDYARIFYHSLTVANCARNGALYASDPVAVAQSPYASIQDAALADAGNLSPTPTVTSTTGTDSDGNPYVEVTVTHDFQTAVNYPGIPQITTISRTVRMRVSPTVPN